MMNEYLQMKNWNQLVVGISFILTSTCVESAATCDAPELFESHAVYNELVCSGIEKMQEKQYGEAAFLFKKALATPLFEMPNFELLPRLALAYLEVGDLKKAKHILRKAELSLLVFSGQVECKEEEDGFYLSWSNELRVDNGHSYETAKIMCGAAYDYIYERRSLERVLQEAELVKNYFNVQQRVLTEMTNLE